MIYSTRFASGNITSAASANSWGYVVPAGKVMVLRSLDALSQVAGAVYVGTSQGSGVWIWSTSGMAAFSNKSWDGRQVFTEGQSLNALWFSGQFWIMASGYLLDA